jgi:hypothetical protein
VLIVVASLAKEAEEPTVIHIYCLVGNKDSFVLTGLASEAMKGAIVPELMKRRSVAGRSFRRF